MKDTLDLANRAVLSIEQQRLGLMSNYAWCTDPKHLAFTLSRYKFVSKMLSGKKHVLEAGCGDAFASRIVLQEVGKLTAVDIEPLFVEDIATRMDPQWEFEAKVHDILRSPLEGGFDGIYSLDVLEHIPPENEDAFLRHLTLSLLDGGAMLIGMPSLESQQYASSASKQGHINCKTSPQLCQLMKKYFRNVFMFSMNDEVVHTGYSAMSHYIIALCCERQ